MLVALNDLKTSTVSGLVSETSLPKATVIRLLQTLQGEGYAVQNPETLTWRVTPKVASLSRSMEEQDEIQGLIQVALDMLAEQIKWPTEYLVLEGQSMVTVTDNRERAPIKLKLFERRRFPLIGSAAGIVTLSTFPAKELAQCLARLTQNAVERQEARTRIDEARQQGYALRGLPELGPNMRVVSVPVPLDGGALSVIHFDDVVSTAQLKDELLPKIRKCAQQVAAARQGTYPQ